MERHGGRVTSADTLATDEAEPEDADDFWLGRHPVPCLVRLGGTIDRRSCQQRGSIRQANPTDRQETDP
jgi:hypothetical protein